MRRIIANSETPNILYSGTEKASSFSKYTNEIIKKSKNFGARRIFVDMDIGNKKVIDFYMKNNFIKAGIIKNMMKIKDV